jgi:hypothetical protein
MLDAMGVGVRGSHKPAITRLMHHCTMNINEKESVDPFTETETFNGGNFLVFCCVVNKSVGHHSSDEFDNLCRTDEVLKTMFYIDYG